MAAAPDAPYTEEDVRLVALTLWDECRRELRPGGHLKDEPTETCFTDARAVLAALSSAGRLVPPGSEVREEWGTRHLDIESHRRLTEWCADRIDAERYFADLDEVWGHHAELIQRKVITTPPSPWSPSVPDTEEGS